MAKQKPVINADEIEIGAACHPCGVDSEKLDAAIGESPDSAKRRKEIEKLLAEDKYAPGKKFDQGKTRWDLVPWEAVEPLAEVLTFGASKYGPNSWQQVENAVERYKAALFRHLIAWCKGERKDPESGRSHLHHVLANCVFLIWFELHGFVSTSGFKDDEKYMTTEQRPTTQDRYVQIATVPDDIIVSICRDCSQQETCQNLLFVKHADGHYSCPKKSAKEDDSSLEETKPQYVSVYKKEVSPEAVANLCRNCDRGGHTTCESPVLLKSIPTGALCCPFKSHK